jgi:hypothetical protein
MSPQKNTPAPPGEPAWDIQFTRLASVVGPQMTACTEDIVRRFRSMGLGCDAQTRQTPRGVSNFVAVMGERGLICIVDITLLDGMALGQGAYASLETRLLDARGDVVATALGKSVDGQTFNAVSAANVITTQNLGQVATAVFVAALGLFRCRPCPSRSA